ncbi:Beta-hexosaminidase like protein [Aduncisulcus paluster]|uniref:beta-N-acetylhexosaminidase n=1 Tax=Aduncisulcus paluster TaxID=2918883 RepID=A0ABQ5KBI6_9EUKA|nr:Beta-hexosaminidase like protein [Aduncisulcus paluster]
MEIVDGDTLYGGYYTQDDIREVVAFAKDRGIDIIPEIDMPGHFLAAIENYDGISCFKQTGWGEVFSSPICPGKESALEFCKNVYSEVFKLFPYEYVHLGADEVDKTNWKKCPDCQKRMRENGLKTEEELQACGYNKASIHYTTDGSFPTPESELYAGPIKIDKTTNFSFRYFYPDGSKGDIFETKFIKGEYTPSKDTTLTNSGLKALWHEYRGSSCEEIEQAPLNGEYTAPGVAIPKEVKGNIGLVLTGYINVAEKDIYTFKLLSDDGSILYIDNEEVINNDGAHSSREVAGMKALDKGLHPIKVLYFDSNGGKLQLTVLNSKGENISETDNLYRSYLSFPGQGKFARPLGGDSTKGESLREGWLKVSTAAESCFRSPLVDKSASADTLREAWLRFFP